MCIRDSIRFIERSTDSHNTIMLNDINQSEIWNSFRVGRLAKVTKLIENKNMVRLSHNGYKHIGLDHNREFLINEKSIIINDKIKGLNIKNIKSFLHFHPDRKIQQSNNCIYIDNKVELKFQEVAKELAPDPLNVDRLILNRLFHQTPDLPDKNNFN